MIQSFLKLVSSQGFINIFVFAEMVYWCAQLAMTCAQTGQKQGQGQKLSLEQKAYVGLLDKEILKGKTCQIYIQKLQLL